MKKAIKVYCAHPITGLDIKEVVSYFNDIKNVLDYLGYITIVPLLPCLDETEQNVIDVLAKACNDKNIFFRSLWAVKTCDIMLLNLIGAKNVSFGCMFELAWAKAMGKYTITVMEHSDNIHDVPFVREASDIIFNKIQDAVCYLKNLDLTQE